MSVAGLESVLVVDDHEELCKCLVDWLKPDFKRVEAVGTCADVRALLETGFWPDLILLDYQLPDGTGVEVLEIVEEMEGRLPAVIAMSGEADATAGFDLRGAGAQQYLPKGFGAEELREAIAIGAAEAPLSRLGDCTLPDLTEEMERSSIEWALRSTGQNISQAAALLGIKRQNLQHKMKRFPDRTKQGQRELLESALRQTGGNVAQSAVLLDLDHRKLERKIKRFALQHLVTEHGC